MPAGLDEGPDALADDEEDQGQLRHAHKVGADEEDAAADEQAEGLVENQFDQHVAVADIVAHFETGPPRLCLGRVVVPLLLQLASVAERIWEQAADGGVPGWEPVLQEELDDVADLGAHQAVQGKLADLLPVEDAQGILPAHQELHHEVG